MPKDQESRKIVEGLVEKAAPFFAAALSRSALMPVAALA